jgi:hypothetical protein
MSSPVRSSAKEKKKSGREKKKKHFFSLLFRFAFRSLRLLRALSLSRVLERASA